MDNKSLYTVIPSNEGLLALKYFLDKRDTQDPPTYTLLGKVELVLTLNSFEFNGEYFKQISGVAMGSKLGPNNACLFATFTSRRYTVYTSINFKQTNKQTNLIGRPS